MVCTAFYTLIVYCRLAQLNSNNFIAIVQDKYSRMFDKDENDKNNSHQHEAKIISFSCDILASVLTRRKINTRVCRIDL